MGGRLRPLGRVAVRNLGEEAGEAQDVFVESVPGARPWCRDGSRSGEHGDVVCAS